MKYRVCTLVSSNPRRGSTAKTLGGIAAIIIQDLTFTSVLMIVKSQSWLVSAVYLGQFFKTVKKFYDVRKTCEYLGTDSCYGYQV